MELLHIMDNITSLCTFAIHKSTFFCFLRFVSNLSLSFSVSSFFSFSFHFFFLPFFSSALILRHWVLFDDATSRSLGPSLNDALLACARGHFLPSLLFYQQCKTSVARDLIREHLYGREDYQRHVDAHQCALMLSFIIKMLIIFVFMVL